MRVLITGGAGFIGFHLASRLSEEGHDVLILDNFQRGREDKYFADLIAKNNVELLNIDLTKKEDVLAIKGTFDVIFHLAAINGTENFYNIPDKVLNVGVLSMLNLLEWYSKNPKGRFIVASSSEAYAGSLKLLGDKFPIPTPENVPLVIEDPSNVRWSYGASKILSEVAMFSYAKARNLDDFSIVRFHNIYGTRMGTEHVIPQFVERLVNKEDPFLIYGGDETRTFCHVDDAVDALKLIASDDKAKGEIIHIGRDDEELTILDLAKSLMKVAGNSYDFNVKPAPAGCVKRRCPDITKLKSLGYKPKITLSSGLEKTYVWYKDFYEKKGDIN